MPIGVRQLIVMTNLAMNWPKPLSTNQAVIKFPWPIQTKSTILERLKERGFIEDLATDEYHHLWILTKDGWDALVKAPRSPVQIDGWSIDGEPENLNIRKSTRPEFQVLYAEVPG